MKIVTISSEFGSGGRELGKRLAEELNCDYYDKEIISEIDAGMPVGRYLREKLRFSARQVSRVKFRRNGILVNELPLFRLCRRNRIGMNRRILIP